MLDHTKSSITIYHTKDYARFRMIDGNRQLNEVKIKKIINDITNGLDVLRYCPIMVVENKGKLDIIDGQHRFYISRKLKSPVWYIIAENISLYEIARINSNTEKWKNKDFINCYINLGNKHYQELRDIRDKYPVSVTDAVNLLHFGKPHASERGDFFQQGKMEARFKDYTYMILKTADLFKHEQRFKRPFLQAIALLIEKNIVPVTDVAKKISDNINELQYETNYKKLLVSIENVYNKGKHNRVRIY